MSIVEVTNMNLTNDQLWLLILEQQLQNAKAFEWRCTRRVHEADRQLIEAQGEVARLINEIESRRAEMLKRRCV